MIDVLKVFLLGLIVGILLHASTSLGSIKLDADRSADRLYSICLAQAYEAYGDFEKVCER
jgi:hypothetical protein